MPNVMTIIAYMPDGATSFRGCTVEQWGASLEIAIFEEIDDSANFICRFLRQNDLNRESNDIGKWNVNVLINGKNTNSSDWASGNDDLVSQDYSPDLTEPEEGLLNLLRGRCAKRYEEMVVEYAKKAAELRAAAEAKAAAQKAAQELSAKENRRKLFEDLKKEFPNG